MEISTLRCRSLDNTHPTWYDHGTTQIFTVCTWFWQLCKVWAHADTRLCFYLCQDSCWYAFPSPLSALNILNLNQVSTLKQPFRDEMPSLPENVPACEIWIMVPTMWWIQQQTHTHNSTHTVLFWDVFLRVRHSNLELAPSGYEGPIWSPFFHTRCLHSSSVII